MRKGGGAVADRQLGFWCLCITLFALFMFLKLIQVKDNYTLLHHRVNQLESVQPDPFIEFLYKVNEYDYNMYLYQEGFR